MTQNYLLFSIGTTTWGVEDRDDLSTAEAGPIHYLPLAPREVAGMALINEKPVTVLDLGVCLGAAPFGRSLQGSFLLVTRDNITTAFAVPGALDRVTGNGDSVIPLPVAARSSVVNSCLVREDSLVPLIDLQNLLERAREGTLDAPEPAPPASPGNQASAPPSSVLVFPVSGEPFCIDAANACCDTCRPDSITNLPYAHQLAGVILRGRNIVPVLSLSERIGLKQRNVREAMIFIDSGETRTCLIVDGNAELNEDVITLPLPPLARTDWSTAAVMLNNEIIPLIELQQGSVPTEAGDGNSLAGQYHPDSSFPGRFLKESVEIIELSLFGTCHAVPKDEVADVLPLLPVRRLPQVPEIVLGVAEHAGRLLPVLDLEAIFGRRSAITADWKMLRITNNDFDALVVVETVFNGREIPPDMQRRMPIEIPHEILYGCYLGDSAVRLILNVEALSVHFEKTGVREIIAGMSPVNPTALVEPRQEREAAPVLAELSGAGVPAGLPSEDRFTKETASNIREAAAQEERRKIDEEARQRIEAEAAERAAAEARVKAEEETRRQLREEESRHREEEARRGEAEAAERAAEEARAKAEEEVRRQLREKNRREEEARRIETEAAERAAEEAQAKAEEEARRQLIEEERRNREEDAKKRVEAEAREREEHEARARAEEKARQSAIEEEQQRIRSESAPKQRADEPLNAVAGGELPAGSSIPTGTAAAPASKGLQRGRNRKLLIAAVSAALAVMAMLHLFGTIPEPVKHTLSIKPAGSPAKVAQKAGGRKETEAPLYLNVPPFMPQPEPDLYIVVKGDTLWDIAQRFTGNPYNYPRVARDNSIATPDLIFPGQKIKLLREKHSNDIGSLQ